MTPENSMANVLTRVLAVGTILTSLLTNVAAANPADRGRGRIPGHTSFQSPSGVLGARVGLGASGRLTYSVMRDGATVIEPSAMGVTIEGVDLGQGVRLEAPTEKMISETYPVMGSHSVATNHCRAVSIGVEHQSSGVGYQLDLRLYDEGFAWRYRVSGAGERTVNGEASSFCIPAKTRVWYFERANSWKLKSYAGQWCAADVSAMPKVSPTGPVQGFPLVLELPSGHYGALCESAVFDYSGMRVRAVGGRTFRADFTEGKQGFPLEGDIVTPWRVVIAVGSLDELVNQTLVMNLAPAPDPGLFADRSWIRPGWCVWRWQLQGVGQPRHQQQFVNYAAELGYPYTLVDDGWEYYWAEPYVELKKLCSYALTRKVGVFVWKRWSDVENPAGNYAQLRQWLDRVAAAGVVGVKVDFFNAEDLVKRRGEEAVLREAARRRLLVNFHGCPKPTGEARTYPNEITREGVRGLELNFMREGPLSPRHNAALPFTRFAVGHGDYTPVTFQPGHLGGTTITHQLATALLTTSPLQVLSEIPTNVIRHPVPEVTEFLKTLPTVWDETRVLPGSRIGDLAVMARRKADSWYVGALNGGDARTYDLNLEFLGDTTYRAIILSDGTESSLVVKATRQQVTASDSLNLKLASGGGFVAVFSTGDDNE